MPGGIFNEAGTNSFAAGTQAKARHTGAFVWADSTQADFASSAVNQFLVRAAGGVGVNTTSTPDGGLVVNSIMHINNYDLFLRSDTDRNHGLGWYGSGKPFAAQNPDGPVLFGWVGGMLGTKGGGENWSMKWDTSGNITTRGVLNPPSDRNVKTKFTTINPRDVLDKVSALPITTWEYKDSQGTRHLGPVAQDFHAAFGLGTDDKHIATVDADGVALAAIQGLNEKLDLQVKAKEAALQSLREQNELLEKRLADLEKLVQTISQ